MEYQLLVDCLSHSGTGRDCMVHPTMYPGTGYGTSHHVPATGVANPSLIPYSQITDCQLTNRNFLLFSLSPPSPDTSLPSERLQCGKEKESIHMYTARHIPRIPPHFTCIIHKRVVLCMHKALTSTSLYPYHPPKITHQQHSPLLDPP